MPYCPFRGYFRFALALFFSLTFFKLLVKKITYCTFTNSLFYLLVKLTAIWLDVDFGLYSLNI